MHSKTFYTMLSKVFSSKNVTKWEFLAFYFLPWYSNCVRLGILNCSKQRRITFFCNFLQKIEKCYSFFFELWFFLALGECISCQTNLLISQSTRRKQFHSELEWNNTFFFHRFRRKFWISTDSMGHTTGKNSKKKLRIRRK